MINEPMSSEAVIGEMVTINCTTTTKVGVTQLPNLTLTHPNGTNFSRTEEWFLSITLDPVHVEDAGEYICIGKIDLEDITSATAQDRQIFTFECKCTLYNTITSFLTNCFNSYSAHPSD